MKEINNHSVYKLIKNYYDEGVALDYVILENDENDEHSLESHKKAAIAGMDIIKNRYSFLKLIYDDNKMSAEKYPIEQFFAIPNDPYYNDKPDLKSRSWEMDEYAEYAYAFLEPPYGNKCLLKDWKKLNSALFPNKNNLVIYKWSTNWSNYFDAGLEWWGAFYWTIYDKEYDTYVVVAGSTTD